jgi:hypothetical protein
MDAGLTCKAAKLIRKYPFVLMSSLETLSFKSWKPEEEGSRVSVFELGLLTS